VRFLFEKQSPSVFHPEERGWGINSKSMDFSAALD
jgi:hypothetical protein